MGALVSARGCCTSASAAGVGGGGNAQRHELLQLRVELGAQLVVVRDVQRVAARLLRAQQPVQPEQLLPLLRCQIAVLLHTRR